MVRFVALVALLSSPAAHAFGGGPTRVVGGDPAELGTWNDTAGIVFGGGGGGYVGCTGTLIAPDLVITASHCLGDHVVGVLLGTVDFTSDEGEFIRATDWHARDRGPNGRPYDIGVIELERDSVYTPRAVAAGCVLDDYLDEGAPVAIVGWGATDIQGNRPTHELMEAFTEVTDPDCTNLDYGCIESISPGGEIGAGGDGVDACYGDSGGPLYLQTEVGDYVIGVTSRAYSWVPWDEPCYHGGIYVRVDAVLPWIEDVTGQEIEEPTCNFLPEPKVRDGSFAVPMKKKRSTKVLAKDPDQGGGHQFAIVEQGSLGTAEIDDDGQLTYRAGEVTGQDTVVVSVTDTEGYPHHEVRLTVPVEVVERGLLGCSTVPAPAGGWALGLLALLGLGRRRRG